MLLLEKIMRIILFEGDSNLKIIRDNPCKSVGY